MLLDTDMDRPMCLIRNGTMKMYVVERIGKASSG